MMSQRYNDKLDYDQQVSAEERIAATIFDYQRNTCCDANGDEHQLMEYDCQMLSQRILLSILAEFRPDLITETTTKKKRGA
jgi:hypothetical protein